MLNYSGSRETGKAPSARRSALQVVYLAGGDGVAAQLAAHWTTLLARERLEVDAIGPRGTASAPLFHCIPAGLVVVIHCPGEPGPLLPDHCGGRVDWHLAVGTVGPSLLELSAQVQWHVVRLLRDLGITANHPELIPARCTHGPSTPPKLPACRLAA